MISAPPAPCWHVRACGCACMHASERPLLLKDRGSGAGRRKESPEVVPVGPTGTNSPGLNLCRAVEGARGRHAPFPSCTELQTPRDVPRGCTAKSTQITMLHCTCTRHLRHRQLASVPCQTEETGISFVIETSLRFRQAPRQPVGVQ